MAVASLMLPNAPRLVLASGSVARRALMRAAGLRFDIVPAAVEEGAVKRAMQADGAAPEAVAAALASAKAEAVDAPGALVIGADQILVCEGEWFDKPGDVDGVMEHLLRLRGRSHRLVTAVSCWRDGAPVWHDLSCPELTMRAFSTGFLESYLALEGEARAACVGGYRFEGLGRHLFERVVGEQAAIEGLPMMNLLAFLRRAGVLMA